MKRLDGVVLVGLAIGGHAVEWTHYALKPENQQEGQPETHSDFGGGAALPRSTRAYVRSVGTALFMVGGTRGTT